MTEIEMQNEFDKLINETQSQKSFPDEPGSAPEVLTAQAEELRREYVSLSEELGLDSSEPLALRWEKLLGLCSGGAPGSIRLLNMYISDCCFFGIRPEDDCTAGFSATKERLDMLTDWEKWYSAQSPEFSRLSGKICGSRVSHAQQSSEHEIVFNLMMKHRYAPGDTNPGILRDNLGEISSFIQGAGLCNISPLIWFLVIVHNQKKLCRKPGFMVNPQNILRYQEYNILQNNGKNFDQYEQYCNLYLDLKEAFQHADLPLCDFGFLKCSNLAQWCCDFVEFPCGIPYTASGIIDQFSPDFFSSPWDDIELLRSSGVSFEELENWEFAHSELTGLIQNAAGEVRLSDLRELLTNSRGFIHGLAENSGVLDAANPENVFMTLLSLCRMSAARIEELIAEQAANAIIL